MGGAQFQSLDYIDQGWASVDGKVYVFGKDPLSGASSDTMDTKWDEVQFYEPFQTEQRFIDIVESPALKTKWQKSSIYCLKL